MIQVSVMYPHRAGARFDFDDYRDRHLPLVLARLGAACKGHAIDRGVRGGRPGTPPLYIATCRLMFDSIEAFEAAFAPHAAEIIADTPNYTDIAPVMQVSVVPS